MKKLATLLAVVATLAGNCGFAQTTSQNPGRAAASSRSAASDDFSWLVALSGLVVVGVVVGVAAGSAASTPSTFSH